MFLNALKKFLLLFELKLGKRGEKRDMEEKKVN